MSDSVQPHRWQPIKLPRPWDSQGKNTGVGCHFLLQCMKVKSESEVTQLCLTQRPHGLQPTRLLHPWDFPGKSTGVGCHLAKTRKQIMFGFSSHMHWTQDKLKRSEKSRFCHCVGLRSFWNICDSLRWATLCYLDMKQHQVPFKWEPIMKKRGLV